MAIKYALATLNDIVRSKDNSLPTGSQVLLCFQIFCPCLLFLIIFVYLPSYIDLRAVQLANLINSRKTNNHPQIKPDCKTEI